jgi:hypothetical protein
VATMRCGVPPGAAGDDISISTIDVAGLDPEDAVSKLVAQNQALAAHASRLKNIGDDNWQLRADNDALLSRTRQLELELARQKEVLGIAKTHHRRACALHRLLRA